MSIVDYLLKGKEKHDERISDYDKWAYPYGVEQKKAIKKVLKELLPKEDSEISVYNYLTCKQALAPKSYDGKYTINFDVPKLRELAKTFNFKDIKNLYKCIALVEADSKIDESLNYPDAESLCKRAEEIRENLN